MRILLAAALAFALTAPGHSQSNVFARHDGNVLILLADDLGVDQVGVYGEGADPPSTPTIDALAATGVYFRNAWADPACSPSRADIMTGRFGFRTGVGFPVAQDSTTGWALDPAEETIPEVLDRYFWLGYSHATIGKWHIGNATVGGPLAPNIAGWSHYAGTLGNIGMNESYEDYDRTVNGTTARSQIYATTETIDDAIAWIQARPDPWVCYVAFNAPHTPLHAPPAHLHSVTLPQIDPRLDPIPFYRAMVEAMDTEIDRLLTALGGRMRNTTVIFMGDNGSPTHAVQAPFDTQRAKLSPYEGGLNVPLVVAGPDVVQPGREVRGLVTASDLFATTLEIAGIPMDGAYPPGSAVVHDSVSLLPYLRNPAQASLRPYAYANLFSPNDPSGVGTALDQRAVRDLRYKLIRKSAMGGPATEEFYDLTTDPFEAVDLLQGTLNPDEMQAYEGLRDELLQLIQ